MEKSKVVYDIREVLNAISDDRYISDRYILHLVGNARASVLRKMVGKKISFNPVGLQQNIRVPMSKKPKSLTNDLTVHCTVLSNTSKLPKLINYNTYGVWYKIRTIDPTMNTVEIIEPYRVSFLTWEFNVPYGFIDVDGEMYFLTKDNNQNVTDLILTGIFDDPLEADPDLTDYPMDSTVWDPVKKEVLKYLLNRPADDPLNNSEPNWAAQVKTQGNED